MRMLLLLSLGAAMMTEARDTDLPPLTSWLSSVSTLLTMAPGPVTIATHTRSTTTTCLTITTYSTTTTTITVSPVHTSANSTTVVPQLTSNTEPQLTSDTEPQLTSVRSTRPNTTSTGIPSVQPATNTAAGSKPKVLGVSYIHLPDLLLAVLVFSWMVYCV